MSLVLAWNDDSRGVVFSDGLLVDGAGKPIAFDHRKFFKSRAGSVLCACGQLAHCTRFEAAFRDSDAGFQELASRASEFVAQTNKTLIPGALSRPLGAIILGIEDGRVRSANIGAGGVSFSIPGRPAFHFMVGGDADGLIYPAGCALLSQTPENTIEVSDALRSLAETVCAKFPGLVGGTLFSTTLAVGASAVLNKQASAVAAGDNSAFSATAGTDYIDVWNDSGSYPLPDGSTQSFAANGSSSSPAFSFTGLSPSTTYTFVGYYDVISGETVVLKVPSSPTPTWWTQNVFGDNHAVLFTAWTITTTSSGTSPVGGSTGGGGATCPAEDQLIETRERGFVPAGTLRRGEHVRGWRGEWNQIRATKLIHGWLHHVTVGRETYHVDLNHRWLPAGVRLDAPIDDWLPSVVLCRGDRLRTASGKIEAVRTVGEPHTGRFMEISVERQRFRIGKLIAHNTFTLPQFY